MPDEVGPRKLKTGENLSTKIGFEVGIMRRRLAVDDHEIGFGTNNGHIKAAHPQDIMSKGLAL